MQLVSQRLAFACDFLYMQETVKVNQLCINQPLSFSYITSIITYHSKMEEDCRNKFNITDLHFKGAIRMNLLELSVFVNENGIIWAICYGPI